MEVYYNYVIVIWLIILKHELRRRIIILSVDQGLQFPAMENFKDRLTEKGVALAAAA